jgi:hypothetical protein
VSATLEKLVCSPGEEQRELRIVREVYELRSIDEACSHTPSDLVSARAGDEAVSVSDDAVDSAALCSAPVRRNVPRQELVENLGRGAAV